MAFSSPTVDMVVQEKSFKYGSKVTELKLHYSIKSFEKEFSTRKCSMVENSLHSIMIQHPDSTRKQINTFTGTMPIGFILHLANSNSTQLRHFVISNTDISNNLANEIAEIINENPMIECIELSNNNLQEHGFMKIVKSFKVLKNLQCLNLNYNKISANVADALSRIIENRKLCHLEMSHCSLGDHEMVIIAKSLANTISLTKVNFCSSTITDVAAHFLSSALSNSSSINFSGCNLQEHGINVILSALKSVKSLDLSCSVISNNAASRIAVLKNVVEHLGLSSSKLQYSELYLLTEEFDGTLKSLSYSFNFINDIIADGLATLLRSSKCFEHLELSHCEITENGFAKIMKALNQQEHLTYLDMKSTPFYIQEIAYFTGMLWSNSYLEYLDLSNCLLKQEFLIKICDVLAEQLSLKHFDLSHNNLTNECAISIGDVIISNLQLQYLSLHHNALMFNGVKHIVTTVIRTCDLRECIYLQLSDNLLHSHEISCIKAELPSTGIIQLYL